MTTRRQFITNLALAGFGFPLSQVVPPSEPSALLSTLDMSNFVDGGFWFLGVTDTPILHESAVKDLKLHDRILRAKDQLNGSVINSGGECFVVNDGKYLSISVMEVV